MVFKMWFSPAAVVFKPSFTNTALFVCTMLCPFGGGVVRCVTFLTVASVGRDIYNSTQNMHALLHRLHQVCSSFYPILCNFSGDFRLKKNSFLSSVWVQSLQPCNAWSFQQRGSRDPSFGPQDKQNPNFLITCWIHWEFDSYIGLSKNSPIV